MNENKASDLHEWQALLNDYRTGELPADQILDFLVWLFGKMMWFFFALVVLGTAAALMVTR